MAHFSEIEKFDGSFAINAPRTFDVPKAIKSFLSSRNQALIEYATMSVETARNISSTPVPNHLEWHLIDTPDHKVWDTLLKAIEEDKVRVVGLFHGTVPETISSRMPVLDVGESVAARVPKSMVKSVSTLIEKKKHIHKGGWEFHDALTALCYEVLYGKATTFPTKVIDMVPKDLAYKFLNVPIPKSGWSDTQAALQVNLFIDSLR